MNKKRHLVYWLCTLSSSEEVKECIKEIDRHIKFRGYVQYQLMYRDGFIDMFNWGCSIGGYHYWEKIYYKI